MKNHVKLEIAIQIIAERIAELYNMRNNAKTTDEVNDINKLLIAAYEKKEGIALGNLQLINEILNVEDGEE